MEDVDRGVAVRANERLSSLKLNHCSSRHLPYSKRCLNEKYVPDTTLLSVCDVTHNLHAGTLRCMGNVVI